jgi:hypothetical protein
MKDDLLDTIAALDWAKSQLPILQQRLYSWLADEPYSIRIDTDTEPGTKLYRLCNIKPLNPILAAEAGAIIHSIRSSFDILACTLAARNGFPGDKATYFPVWKTESALLADTGKGPMEKIKRLSQIDKDIIMKDIKPYRGGNDLLVTLHELDLTRKHRRMLEIYSFARGMNLSGFAGVEIERARWAAEWKGFKNDAVLVSTSADAPDGDVYLGLNVAFGEYGTLNGENFPNVIRDYLRLGYDVVSKFQ